jgi:hypothetical protein
MIVRQFKGSVLEVDFMTELSFATRDPGSLPCFHSPKPANHSLRVDH